PHVRGARAPVAGPSRALDLALEHPPRRLLDGLALLGVHVADHQRGLGQPGDQPQGPEVGDELHVAVAALPRGEGEAGLRLHVHVDGEQINTGVHAVVDDGVEEVATDHALAHETGKPVGKDGEDRVDLALADELGEGRKVEPARHDADSSAWPHDRKDGAMLCSRPCRPSRAERSAPGWSTTSRTRRSRPSCRPPSSPPSTPTSSWATPTAAAISGGARWSRSRWCWSRSRRRCWAGSPITPASASRSSWR